MSFFGMGPTEFLVIAVIAFVIFGPEKFTELAGTVGKFVRDFRSMSGGITGEFQQAMNEFQQVGTEIKQVGGEIRQVTGEIQDNTRNLLQGSDQRTLGPRSISEPALEPSYVRDSGSVGSRPSKADPLADFGSFAEAVHEPAVLPASDVPAEESSSEPAA
ncbi:MAG: twin-arginine translocase TatA/TatE family subunit [Nitrolancea sp.]